MPIIPFTIPLQVPLLLSGAKKQTTRQPRKRPLKVGDVLHCYFKPRQKKNCNNCLTYRKNRYPSYSLCPALLNDRLEISYDCCDHNNYFGTAVVTSILCIRPDRAAVHQHSFFADLVDLEAWAKLDGFENFEKADEWFTVANSIGGIDGSDWINWAWDIITFEPGWIK